MIGEAVIFYAFLKMVMPNTSIKTQKLIKIKKRTLAIEAAPEAILVKPRTADIKAIIRKRNDQRSIV